MNHKKKKKTASSGARAKDAAPGAPVASAPEPTRPVPPASALPPSVPASSRARFAAILLGLALVLAIYLGWLSATGKPVAGCGPESGCGQILKSRWSQVLGMPVSLLGAGVYAFLFWASLCRP